MIQIAIDGPSGAGKSTLAKTLAKHFGFVYVDTGALYRSVGLYMCENSISKDDRQGIIKALDNIDVSLTYENGTQHVILCGKDVSDKIRTPEISMWAATVSAIPEVRTFLLSLQKDIADKNNIIMDGRDIGTVILPHADVKIFLVSSFEARAKRRHAELTAKGVKTTFEEVLSDIIERDSRDTSRDTAPLVKADDAIILDNSEFEFEQTLEAAKKIILDKICDKV